MANFRIYPGMFIVFTQDYEKIKAGTVLQIIHCGGHFRSFITFVGVDTVLPIKNSGKYIAPIP